MSAPVTPRALALSTLLSIEQGKYGNIAVDIRSEEHTSELQSP